MALREKKQMFSRLKNRPQMVVAVVFAAVGVALIVRSQAATPTAFFEAESATKTGNISQINDSGASGGSALKFGASGSSGWTDRCPAYPQFPDANCTGPTSSNLPLYTGPHEITTNGTVIENVEIRTGFFAIYADNVTVRNVKFVFTGGFEAAPAVVWLDSTTRNATFQDCEVDGKLNASRGIAGDNGTTTIRNCNIHHVGNGIELSNHISSLYEGNYLNEIMAQPGNPTDWHCDGIQSWSGDDNLTIRHNTILLHSPETGAINVSGPPNTADPSLNVLIENNLVAGGGYTLYVGPSDSTYRVINNHISTMYYPKGGSAGAWYYDDTDDGTIIRTGNVIHETGAVANYGP